jgi:hypothetical protein
MICRGVCQSLAQSEVCQLHPPLWRSMNDQDVLKPENISITELRWAVHLGIYLWLQVSVCEGGSVHQLYPRKYLLRDISSLRFRYLPAARQYVLFEVSKFEVLHCKKDIGAIFEPTEKLNEYSGISRLRGGQLKEHINVHSG